MLTILLTSFISTTFALWLATIAPEMAGIAVIIFIFGGLAPWTQLGQDNPVDLNEE